MNSSCSIVVAFLEFSESRKGGGQSCFAAAFNGRNLWDVIPLN